MQRHAAAHLFVYLLIKKIYVQPPLQKALQDVTNKEQSTHSQNFKLHSQILQCENKRQVTLYNQQPLKTFINRQPENKISPLQVPSKSKLFIPVHKRHAKQCQAHCLKNSIGFIQSP